MSQTTSTPPNVSRAQRPPRFNFKNQQFNNASGMSAGISMPPTAQPPYTAQTQYTMSGSAGQPHWPNYANPFAAGNFMAKGFEGFVDFTKSGMSFGEKFTYGLYEKFSKWSKKWFTHVFLFIVVILYTAGGAAIFNFFEKGEEKPVNGTDLTQLQMDLYEALRNLSKEIEDKTDTIEINNIIMGTLRNHSFAVTSIMPRLVGGPPPNKTTTSIQEDWQVFWNQMFYAGTVYTTIERGRPSLKMNHEAHEPAVRRRRKISRSMREKSPDPIYTPTTRRKLSDYDDENSNFEATTASEEAAQIVSMQIRPPGTMSAHQSKILRRRDKTFANTAARSLSQPRQAERLSSPEAQDLIKTAVKRSLSTPRHKDESSESELQTPTIMEFHGIPMDKRATALSAAIEQEGPVATADENLSRLELNLRRFEEERKRLEYEKRLFEREKREHRTRLKQLPDNEERKRLLQNYRKLSDRIQLPTDAEERRRMVHSLRLNKTEAPQLVAKRRPNTYDESSTQFSSSDADVDETRFMVKKFSPTRRHAPAHKLDSVQSSVRGPPPQPPARSSVSRNNSLSPIRPQRRSKTPEQHAAVIQEFNSTTNEVGIGETEVKAEKITPDRSSTEANEKNVVRKRSTQRKDSLTETAALTKRSTQRKDSLTETAVLKRRKSLENGEKVIRRKRSLERVVVTPPKVTDATEIPHLQRWFEKIYGLFKKKKPITKMPIVDEDNKVPPQIGDSSNIPPQRILSISFLRQFRLDCRDQWQFLVLKYPEDFAEFRRQCRKCFANTILLILLCGFGALIFRYTEGASENIYKCEVRKVKRDFIEHLWTVSHNMREDDWKSLARQKLRKFEDELTALQELGIRRIPGSKSWNFVNCIIYCWTVITTIGYGHITPKTPVGQIFTIIYAIIGIPLFLILLADFGKMFTRGLKILWAFVRRVYYTGTCRKIRKQQQILDAISGFNAVYDMAVRSPNHYFGGQPEVADIESQTTEPGKSATGTAAEGAAQSHAETPLSPYPETFEIDDDFNLPISVATCILIAYILIGAGFYIIWEDQWTYFDAIYFIFTSMSTIGFGDIVPTHPIFMMCSIIYLVFGLALTSMFINVIQIKLSNTFKQASAKIGATIGLASEAGDETGSQPKTPSEIASVHGAGRLDKISE